jgi:hypothetical protein
MPSVPREWAGDTAVVIATGPSLTQDDVDYCRGKARVIVVNNAYQIAPWADALYACDAQWWHWHYGAPSFTGPKWSLDHSAWGTHRARYPDVQRLRNTGTQGLEHDPTGLKNGRNSGFQAVNLAYHYGAKRIILLGFDMQARGGKTHYFGDHPKKQMSPYPMFRRVFTSIAKPLQKAGVEVVNCSRNSVLDCFPKADLRVTLKEAA